MIDQPSDMRKVSHLYYIQNLTMDAIARDLGTSRSTVSRLLTRAREEGIVRIEVQSPSDEMTEVELAIKSKYGVTAHVVPIPRNATDLDVVEGVCAAAAHVVTQFFDSHKSMGIAWGATTSAISRHLAPVHLTNTEVVQLNGAGNTQSSGNEFASDIVRRFATAFGSRAHQFAVPAIFDNPATKTAMWKERSVRSVLDLHSKLDVVLFGVGSPRAKIPSHVYRGDYLDASDNNALSQFGVVGDAATIFYRADGTYADIPLNARSSGPDLEALRKVPRRICVASGKSKLLAIRGALNAGIVSNLVIDEPTADWLARSI